MARHAVARIGFDAMQLPGPGLISVVVLGVLAALDPLRPVVFVLVLRTKRVNAIAFLAGWAVALSVLFVVVCVVFGGDISGESNSRQRTWASAVGLILGALLLVIAARRWLRRHDITARHVAPAAILRRLDQLDPRQAGVMGALVQPRTLTVAAALVVARDRSGVLGLLIGFALFAVVSTSALLGILGYDVWRPENADHRLTAVVSHLEQQAPRLLTIVCAFGGCYLLLDGLRGLIRG